MLTIGGGWVASVCGWGWLPILFCEGFFDGSLAISVFDGGCCEFEDWGWLMLFFGWFKLEGCCWTVWFIFWLMGCWGSFAGWFNCYPGLIAGWNNKFEFDCSVGFIGGFVEFNWYWGWELGCDWGWDCSCDWGWDWGWVWGLILLLAGCCWFFVSVFPDWLAKLLAWGLLLGLILVLGFVLVKSPTKVGSLLIVPALISSTAAIH